MLALLSLVALLPQTYLPRAHSHNDYDRAQPLFGALNQGFGSVEADIYLQDGELRVAHDEKDLKPGRTLASMYLDPIARRVQFNKGSVYGKGERLILLVDIKKDAAAVYEVLKAELKRYRRMLTEYRGGKVTQRAVTVILSGDRPTEILAKETNRFAFIDGRLDDLGKEIPASLSPLISDSYFEHFAPYKTQEKIEQAVDEAIAKVHAEGKIIRFWAAADSPAGWKMLWDKGVDLIGTDRTESLGEWMRAAQKG